MQTMLYVGSNKSLKGQTALVRDSFFLGWVLAQFDNTQTGYGYGWYAFPTQAFAPNVGKKRRHRAVRM